MVAYAGAGVFPTSSWPITAALPRRSRSPRYGRTDCPLSSVGKASRQLLARSLRCHGSGHGASWARLRFRAAPPSKNHAWAPRYISARRVIPASLTAPA